MSPDLLPKGSTKSILESEQYLSQLQQGLKNLSSEEARDFFNDSADLDKSLNKLQILSKYLSDTISTLSPDQFNEFFDNPDLFLDGQTGKYIVNGVELDQDPRKEFFSELELLSQTLTDRTLCLMAIPETALNEAEKQFYQQEIEAYAQNAVSEMSSYLENNFDTSQLELNNEAEVLAFAKSVFEIPRNAVNNEIVKILSIACQLDSLTSGNQESPLPAGLNDIYKQIR